MLANILPYVVLGSLAAAQQPKNPFNLISAATLFTGPAAPVIDLGYAKYRGKQDALTDTSNYLGLKYAEAPRFDHSVIYHGETNGSSDKVYDASHYGPACPQFDIAGFLAGVVDLHGLGLGKIASFLEATPLFQTIVRQSEDCLSVNVQRPRDKNLKDLPVVVWIHGGGLASGASSSFAGEQTVLPGVFYQGANLVKKSIEMKQPVIFASINYRLGDFGFSASKELEDAGLLNLGFEDQRNALKWVQKHISKFGGDPSKVTIMGESAGSWSVASHLVANDGDNEGLFRGAIGMSGGLNKVDKAERQQPFFDDLVKQAGCSRANKIQCLRKAPYAKIYEHMQTSITFWGDYPSIASIWNFRPGGKLLSDSPDKLGAAGKIANVPLLMGDMRDEGTLLGSFADNDKFTDQQAKDYFRSLFWHNVSDAQLDEVFKLYPRDPTKGSPFGTGHLNVITPQNKRMAAIVGDSGYESARRQLFEHFKGPIWTYQTEVALPVPILDETFLGKLLGKSGLSAIPILGSFHGFDALFYLFATLPEVVSQNTKHIMTTWISFINNLDPNKHNLENLPHWPQYDKKSKKMYHFQEAGVDIITDDYRQAGMDYFNNNPDAFRL